MWIFTNYGFFSFTQSTYRPGFMQIRARDDRDLEELKRRHGLRGRIIETNVSDYRWRVLCRPATACRIVAVEMAQVDYSNFKNASEGPQAERHHDLMRVWGAMMDVQRRRVAAKYQADGYRISRADQEADESYQRQFDYFDDGTLDEDTLEDEEITERVATTGSLAPLRIHERPPSAFEPVDLSDPENNPFAG